MADLNNLEITENFDTIKTLLNSIRAQGILNTSDVDKLLSGINSKLEKINTEEDIDLIKVFLSELKQNLDERHSVLLSKFGAIESLFSNLLKNSSEALKSNEVKELFDIVATNLSVFSREVVSQKETLTDITLRLDAMRSDDSQKKEIVKNISFLKNDIERLTNGFDSIVLSLNENFKTVIKTISGIDPSENIQKFGKDIEDVVNSANTILSAVQMLDKKNLQIEDSIKGLATQEDLISTKKWISDLANHEQNLTQAIENLSGKYYKIDNLADKIDASVDILAGLKTAISDREDNNTTSILDKLSLLEQNLKDVADNKAFEEFKLSLDSVLKDILNNSVSIKDLFNNSSLELQKIQDAIKALDINVNFKSLAADLNKSEQNIKEHVNVESNKVIQLVDVNTTRTINEISSNADNFVDKLTHFHSLMSSLCEKSFAELEDGLAALKGVIAQIDENNVSANNAIFSNVTDRLAMFENGLQKSLEKQESYVANSSSQLIEEISALKNLSGVLDYKLDSSVIEITNAKNEFSSLKTAVDDVLALDFVNKVKDLRVDLYAIKQDITNVMENSTSEQSDRFTNDLFGKYELLISKLDSVESEIKQAQSNALVSLKPVLENISSSIVDILSYVSSGNEQDTAYVESQLNDIKRIVSDSNLNYVENVRDVVEVILTQVEANLKALQSDTNKKVENLNSVIEANSETIRRDIKTSYEKLLEVQSGFNDIKESVDDSNTFVADKICDVISTADSIKSDFDTKLGILKNALLDKVTSFQQEFTCDNAEKISELKFSSETLFQKGLQNSHDIKDELKGDITKLAGALKLNIEELTEQLAATSLKLEGSNNEIVRSIRGDFSDKVNASLDEVENKVSEFTDGINGRVDDVVTGFENLGTAVTSLTTETKSALTSTLAKILDNFVALKALLTSLNDKTADDLKNSVEVITNEFEQLRRDVETFDSNIDEDLTRQLSIIESNFEVFNQNLVSMFEQNDTALGVKLENGISNIESAVKNTIAENLEQYKNKVETLFDNISEKNSIQAGFISEKVLELNKVLSSSLAEQNKQASEALKAITDDLRLVLEENVESVSSDYEALKAKIEGFATEIKDGNSLLAQTFKKQIDELEEVFKSDLNSQVQEIDNRFLQISENINGILLLSTDLQNDFTQKIAALSSDYETTKTKIEGFATEIKDGNGLIAQNFKTQIDELEEVFKSDLDSQIQKIDNRFSQISEDVNGVRSQSANLQNDFTQKMATLSSDLKDIEDNLIAGYDEKSALLLTNLDEISKKSQTLSENINSAINNINLANKASADRTEFLKQAISSDIIEEAEDLYGKINALFEASSLNFMNKIDNTHSKVLEELASRSVELKASFEVLNSRLDKDEISRMNVFQAQLKELGSTFNVLIGEAKSVTKSEVSAISETLIKNSREAMEEVELAIEDKVNSVLAASADIAAGELQSMEAFTNKIIENIELSKQAVEACKNFINDFIKSQVDILNENIEKETDVIVKDLIEQMNMMREFEKDELSKLTLHIESSIEDYIYEHISDLKSYLDIKTDSSVLNSKLDSITTELTRSAGDILTASNKLLEASVFDAAMSDMKKANEIIVSSMTDNLNKQLTEFIETNVSKDIDAKFALFDKKFTDTVVDKYEEVKLISTGYNNSFESIEATVKDLLSEFSLAKSELTDSLSSVLKNINSGIDALGSSFAGLMAEITNKSFDEAFQTSVNNQIKGLEELIREQFGYLEDISELCCNNLPELTEMNTIVKYNIMSSVEALNSKIEAQEVNVQSELNALKTDVITQFLNIFNQISFVTEQEEILDFIQEKHSELITVLSHIVNTIDDVKTVKETVSLVDNKVDNLKDNIDLINEKITSIISSSGDVDYIYSLQDLESDIANLRITLNDIKENNNSKELDELITSTNDIYSIVDSIKNELPRINTEEFRKDFDSLNEDIVSISTRTNKLILASDESYKTLQENLQDFKLVINDLDERTRNFAQEAGLDRIDNKLGVINTMIQSGAKTNQVFNQVFEYLAEWVDNAGAQITAISDKVETLDDIGQIKVMLEDLKAEAADNSESAELIEALSTVFDKQAKKIASLEAKLDRMIVETTINNKNNQLDITPLEDTLNRFLVAIDDKVSSQQTKINSLEAKLEDVMSLIDPKDTAQLTKKVGGMDRQIAKLNKSIEKIASHVIEK